jgi:hypothetical protein
MLVQSAAESVHGGLEQGEVLQKQAAIRAILCCEDGRRLECSQ